MSMEAKKQMSNLYRRQYYDFGNPNAWPSIQTALVSVTLLLFEKHEAQADNCKNLIGAETTGDFNACVGFQLPGLPVVYGFRFCV